MSLASIPAVLDALRAGRPVLVADDEGRENEGDVIFSAALATQHWMAWTIRNTSGYLCVPLTNEIADRLELPLMTEVNQDVRRTAYTVTVDAAEGITTGISAADRTHTARVLADPNATPSNLIRPGHLVPIRAVEGGVRERAGHTEAAVDLMKLAGLPPVAIIGEVVQDDGEMMRLTGLLEMGEREGLLVTTIAELTRYLDANPADREALDSTAPAELGRVSFEVETTVPTSHGPIRMRAYRDRVTGADHLALVAGEIGQDALIRVHSECLTGEALGSLKCECGPQLDAALETISRDGGVVLYLRGQEGRGIGLINKLRAYRLQEDGLDTLDANLALGLPADKRDYGAAAAMLHDLGLERVRLLSNNPDKAAQLAKYGVTVTEQVPLIVGVGAFNEQYLATKGARMGHLITAEQLQSVGEVAE
ncbi:MAG TPA: GTP cyclohydrolase II [Microbacteriaceae bacterium]|nr:GTP cyclohydrolase II [Microbacteriaceae bacterium]